MFSILASTLMMGEIELDANDDDAAYVKGSAVSSCAVSSVSVSLIPPFLLFYKSLIAK